MKKNIKLTPEMLREMVSESVKRVLSEGMDEISYNALDAAADKADPTWYEDEEYHEGFHNVTDVVDAIKLIRQYLVKMENSFKPLRGQSALSYFYDKKQAPNQGIARQCQEYLDYIEGFVQRKSEQANNLRNGADAKEKEYADVIAQYMNKWNGFKWDPSKRNYENIINFEKTLGEEEWDGQHWVSEFDEFMDSIQDSDIRTYLEEHS